jgi:hypothetical protein
MLLGQPRDQLPPAPPVLRPSVKQKQRCSGARLGDVQANAIDPHLTVLNSGSGEVRKLWR